MRNGIRVLSLTLLFSCGLAADETTGPSLRTGTTASEPSARMLEALGGRRAWAEARTIKIRLRGFYAREPRPWTETFWIDLETARGRFELRGGELDRTIAWTPGVVLFHRLALGAVKAEPVSGDDGSTIAVVDPASGETLARLSVDLRGEPTRWAAKLGGHDVQHLLGPLESFGKIRFPRWGGSVDGIWRYEHLSVELSPQPLAVSFDPPRASGSQSQR